MEESGRQKVQNSNNKQQSTSPANTSTATASNATAGSVHQKKSMKSLVGQLIKIKTILNDDIEGVIYTYDPITNCIAIDQTANSSRKNCSFRIVKIANIKEIISLRNTTTATSTVPTIKRSPSIQPLLIEQLEQREANTTRNVRNEVSKIGIGVTKEAQDIFNALSKTLPCRWSKDTIIVLDEILIPAPYTPESCKANASSANLLARVKKVLEGERKRLAKTTTVKG
ncbi:anticodon-binding domain-containing protein [Mycotypha africana]|uniref:anticodon-binding domain-containing protein n=1 Tax=Mycotypha africana TaxID=64632 RepID=UPI002300D42E|nr:anticodon-binding domain-containing protein [Mycotypha africana]KAI8979196.1 anticodon-binding domain-containing protein [Mycotypha africana]